MTGLQYLILLQLPLLIITMSNWYQGLLMVVVIGFLQDPIRKIVSGEPVFLTVSAIVSLVLVFAIAKSKINAPGFLAPLKQNSFMTNVFCLFLLLIFFQSINSFLSFQSLILSGIGLVSYLAPYPAIWLAYSTAQKKPHITRKIFTIYTVCSIIVAFSLYLSFFGFEYQLLKPVGDGMVISSNYGNLFAHSGFMRSSEVAAWHIATATCILFTLLLTKRFEKYTYYLTPLITLLVYSTFLTGRRKAFGEIVLFLIVYLILSQLLRYNYALKRVLTIGIIGLFIIIFIAVFLEGSYAEQMLTPYLERGQTTFGDANDRLQTVGLASISWAINRFGYFGIGAGAAGLGLQHFGGVVEGAGGAGEAGLGKIVVELGIPGLVIIILLLLSLSQAILSNLRSANRFDSEFPIRLGITALLVANVPLFISSSLIYGDPFVLIVIGFIVGVLLSSPENSNLLSQSRIHGKILANEYKKSI